MLQRNHLHRRTSFWLLLLGLGLIVTGVVALNWPLKIHDPADDLIAVAKGIIGKSGLINQRENWFYLVNRTNAALRVMVISAS